MELFSFDLRYNVSNRKWDFMDIEFYNEQFLSKLSSLLREEPTFLSKELVIHTREIMQVDMEEAVIALLSSKMNLDFLEVEYYLRPSLKCLSPKEYQKNSYYQNIRFPNVSCQKIELGYDIYQPYELFVWNDLKRMEDGRLIPSIGYFLTSYSYPCIREDGNIWMLITPNEIETMKKPIERAFGDVVTYGLGLGYFPYMVSFKDTVSSITIVENNASVIELFQKNILPQFPYPEKIHIVKEDAYSYAKRKKRADYVFIDIYHDVSDGLDAYLFFKLLEQDGVVYDYWIEKSIQCYL